MTYKKIYAYVFIFRMIVVLFSELYYTIKQVYIQGKTTNEIKS
jgi:hypothetical protein